MDEEALNSRLSRISTIWTLLAGAREASETGARNAQLALFERYQGAAYRYLNPKASSAEMASQLTEQLRPQRPFTDTGVRKTLQRAREQFADLLDRFAFSGTPEQIVRQAEALFAAGASRIEFGTPHGFTDAAGVRLLGKRVLPALRA